MAFQILIAVLVVFTFEVVSTGIMFRRLYRRVHILNVWIAAIDEIQDWQLDTHLRERQAYEEFKQATTSALSHVRLTIGNDPGIGDSGGGGSTTQPLNDGDSPSTTNSATWYKDITTYESAHEQRPYWTTSFDGDPDTTDPSKRGAEQRSGDVGE